MNSKNKKQLFNTAALTFGTAIIIIFLMTKILLINNKIVKADTIETHEKQISENVDNINHYEEVKSQLHLTAEIMRQDNDADLEFIDGLSQKWHDYNDDQNKLIEENQNLQKKIDEIKEQQNKIELLGYFTITHYDLCKVCTGKSPGEHGYGITKFGTIATPNKTIAVDPKIIPLGSEIIINGNTYVAEDTGSAVKGNKID